LRSVNGSTTRRYLLDWLAPALFALLVSATIRYHSLAPMPTMPRMVGNLLGLAAVALVGLMALGRRLAVPRDIAVPGLLLMASAIVSVLGSGDADSSLLRLELYLAMGLLAMVFYLTYRDAGQVPSASYFLAVSLVHLPFLLAAVLWIKHLAPPFWQGGHRLAEFGHVRQFGEFGFFAAASGTALTALSRRMIVPSFLLATAALFGLVLTGCRGALLSWVLFVLLLCRFGQTRLRTGLHGLLALACSSAVVVYLQGSGQLLSPNIFARMAAMRSGAMAAIQAGSSPDPASGRIDIWISAAKQIAVHPLFGSGPEGYLLSGCCDRTILQAHDFMLQFLLEFGAVGCGLALWLLMRAIRHLGGLSGVSRLVLASPGNRVLACLLAAYFAYSLIDQTMYHLLPLLLFALFAGLFAAGLAQARGPVRIPD